MKNTKWRLGAITSHSWLLCIPIPLFVVLVFLPLNHSSALSVGCKSAVYLSSQFLHCDQSINWQGWYRLFLGSSNARIPERCIDSNRCGTHAPLWITQPHPSQPGETVTRTVCNNWSGSCCQFPSHTIQVKLCYGNYYVYKLERPSVCHLAYCAGIVAL
uniref:UMOD/GP2/OIT3-like D8C domain-containing protein n=1 Tax=Maylandia zebra TaxID=106582 RepID=A0A3P9DT59_9CICH